jgi:tetraprenyl-beta-curcumene synthase
VWHVADARDAAVTLASLARYWLRILPRVRRELRQWEHRARAIPDPLLREQAVGTLCEERMNAEAAAVFATLVPSSRWDALVPVLVAFQVMYDYLDTVGEHPVEDPLLNGLQLHRALTVALTPFAKHEDYYRHHPARDDGGYLDALVTTCQAALRRMPAAPAVLPCARRAALRCIEGQSHTHAAIRAGPAQLASWAAQQDHADGYLWWEIAGGAISSVAVYALLAAATDERTTAAEAGLIDAAYFPPMCALSTLLDSLIDRQSDALTDNHSSIGHYADRSHAAGRLARIAADADAAVRRLRRGRRHVAILAGIAGYYLSAAGAETEYGRQVAAAVIERLGPIVPVIRATVRLRRHVGDHHPGGS